MSQGYGKRVFVGIKNWWRCRDVEGGGRKANRSLVPLGTSKPFFVLSCENLNELLPGLKLPGNNREGNRE